MAGKDQIAATVRSAYAARLAGDVPAMISHFAEDARLTFHMDGKAGPAEPIVGHPALEAMFAALIATYKIEDWTEVALLVDGDRAAAHWRAKITVAPGGAASTFDIFDFFIFRGDKIVEFDESADSAKLMSLSGTAPSGLSA